MVQMACLLLQKTTMGYACESSTPMGTKPNSVAMDFDVLHYIWYEVEFSLGAMLTFKPLLACALALFMKIETKLKWLYVFRSVG
jgi:hypothetical protein